LVAVPSIGRADRGAPARTAPEADATRELYERYARQIYVYCLHQLGNREEAEDATQSTFLNAFRGLKRGVDPEFKSAWLYKIAQNVCLTRQRSSTRRRRVESPGDLDAMQDSLAAHAPDSDELIDLPEALGLLPEQQRRALLLREWQGLSYREIASELGLTQAAVETLLFRARRALAAGLSSEQDPATPKRVVRKLRAGGDAGSALAAAKTLLFSGGAKVVATVATVAATSVVAAAPSTRHAVEHALAPQPVRRAARVVHVHLARRVHPAAPAASVGARAAARAVIPAAAPRRVAAVSAAAPHPARRNPPDVHVRRHATRALSPSHRATPPKVPVTPADVPAAAAPAAPAVPATPAPQDVHPAAPAALAGRAVGRSDGGASPNAAGVEATAAEPAAKARGRGDGHASGSGAHAGDAHGGGNHFGEQQQPAVAQPSTAPAAGTASADTPAAISVPAGSGRQHGDRGHLWRPPSAQQPNAPTAASPTAPAAAQPEAAAQPAATSEPAAAPTATQDENAAPQSAAPGASAGNSGSGHGHK